MDIITEPSNRLLHLNDLEQLDHIDSLSHENKVFIVKHSTRCGISHAAMEHIERFVESLVGIHFYYLDLLVYRPISNAIVDRYGVPHSSPQVLVIDQANSISHATHYAIDQRWLQKVLY